MDDEIIVASQEFAWLIEQAQRAAPPSDRLQLALEDLA